MTDSSEPHSRRPRTASSVSHLQYPTLPPVSVSVEEWLSRSRPISMTSTPSMDHPRQPLSESWATLSASDVHSEDGAPSEQTDVGSLIDQSSPDDVASLDERYSSNDDMDGNYGQDLENDDYDSRSEVSESQDLLRPIFPEIGGSIDDSNLTSQTAFRQPTDSISFIEPDDWSEGERVQLKHTIRLIDGPEIAELGDNVSSHLENSTLMATVQQTMAKRSIDTDKPFRVLYVGRPEFRGIILDKLGDVLVSSTCSFENSSTESSRYHVVPTSFGSGAVANFAELLPIQFQLIVDECLSATSESHINKPRTINLRFKNRPGCTSLWTGTEYGISSSTEWALPDVTIMFLSTLDTPSIMETQKLARMFMERHGVPTMAVSEKPLWKMSREPIPVNHHSLHMCLESRQSSTGKTTVLKRYPIDLNTFESITPGQLNRNLASLTSIYPRRNFKSTPEISDAHRTEPSFSVKNYTKKILPIPYLRDDTELAFVLRLVMITVLSAATLTVGHLALKAVTVSVSSFVARSVVSNQIPPVPSVYTTSALTTAGSKRAYSPVLSTATSDVQAVTRQHNSLSQLSHLMGGSLSNIEPSKSRESFEIQVVGDCHLVIKPPSRSAAANKQPKFSIQVSRRGQPLQYELSKLFDGVYSLKLDRGEAYGLVNVTITANTKPSVKQIVPVDLGTPWLKIANWKRAAHSITSQLARELGTAQTGLTDAYGRISTDLQILIGDVVRRAHLIRQEASLLGRDSLQLPSGTKEVVLSTSEQLSEIIQRTAVQPFISASTVIQYQTRKVKEEARLMMSGTWGKISAGAQHLSPGLMMEHVRSARKSETLDKAQKRARRLVRGRAS